MFWLVDVGIADNVAVAVAVAVCVTVEVAVAVATKENIYLDPYAKSKKPFTFSV